MCIRDITPYVFQLYCAHPANDEFVAMRWLVHLQQATCRSVLHCERRFTCAALQKNTWSQCYSNCLRAPSFVVRCCGTSYTLPTPNPAPKYPGVLVQNYPDWLRYHFPSRFAGARHCQHHLRCYACAWNVLPARQLRFRERSLCDRGRAVEDFGCPPLSGTKHCVCRCRTCLAVWAQFREHTEPVWLCMCNCVYMWT